jgi:hypothetical protein
LVVLGFCCSAVLGFELGLMLLSQGSRTKVVLSVLW